MVVLLGKRSIPQEEHPNYAEPCPQVTIIEVPVGGTKRGMAWSGLRIILGSA
jgi:hypothetical protein